MCDKCNNDQTAQMRTKALNGSTHAKCSTIIIGSSGILRCENYVRFTPESGHLQCSSRCPLWANSRHQDQCLKLLLLRQKDPIRTCTRRRVRLSPQIGVVRKIRPAEQAAQSFHAALSDGASADSREEICSVNVLAGYEGACRLDISSQTLGHKSYARCRRGFSRSCDEFHRPYHGDGDQDPSGNVF